LVFDFVVWKAIIANKPNSETEIYFLDVGQGDSQLVVLADGKKVLIDGGPNSKIVNELSVILRPTDRYIDLVVLSHPEVDHFNGLIDVLRRYQVGVFIYNGRVGHAESWKELAKILEENKIPAIVLGQRDKIKYQEDYFEVLSPNVDFLKSKELNDTSFVLEFHDIHDRKDNEMATKILFTGDIGSKVEKYLAENFDLADIDVLKVAHHGSKYSSATVFLSAIKPKIAAIEVGKNSYGHPTKETLNKLALIGAQVFRTDQDGTVKLIISNRDVNIFKTK